MKARVTKPFNGRPDDAPYPRAFKPGDIITGDLARAMIEDGSAEAVETEAKAVALAPENKARPRGGRRGTVKAPSSSAPARRPGNQT